MESETPLQNDESIGTTLKSVREKKGISLEDAARITRLRLHFIKALEEEDWNALPAPVFIKGFIRSYARFLGVNQNNAVALFEEITDHIEDSPKPLVEEEKTGRLKIVIPLIILVIAAAAFLLWFYPTSPVTTDDIAMDSETMEGRNSQRLSISDGDQVKREEVNTADEESQIKVSETEQPFPLQNENKNIGKSQQEAIDAPLAENNPGTTEPSNDDSEQAETNIAGSSSAEEQTTLIPEAVPDRSDIVNEDDADLLTLDGIIKIRSYIKIYVDDQPAKEYIFRPGSRPQWRAKKGFDILVGNAAGVEFKFNGKETGELGPLGKVVRVRFPEDFKSGIYEE